ncbi:MAG TPA: hypothetical protein QGH03_01155 [Candidatus Paceibacterota bacterium]|jgi:hypothetical protein|nr:hypothetical protein [Parcubacteria group bacterium]MDP6119579.1 hypothetical protein [Candidatus Paceibacterota bacterium]HJN62824.1 hypothetical protein [Candidatus Paceibacterota bacterium]
MVDRLKFISYGRIKIKNQYMQVIRDSKYSRVVAGVVLFTAAIFMSVGVALATPQLAHGATSEELQAQIDSLLATIAALQAQLNTQSGGGSGTCSYTFSTNYSQGDSGPGVLNVQSFLNMDASTQVAASGVGSSGNETEYFGSLSKGAVVKFQDKYAAEVLTPVGLSAGTGYWGPSSRAHAQSLCDAMTGDDEGEDESATPAPAGSGLTVSSPAQPAAQLAPLGAARIPFTNVTFTASADGDVVVDGIVVQRVGVGVDGNVDGAVLLDENGTQLGIAKTLNSSHQATLTEDFTIEAGHSRTMTIAVNRPASLSPSGAGEVIGMDVVAVNTSAAVSGSLPISGALHTMNESLTIGAVTMARGSTDPGAAQSKEVGETGYTFSSIKVSAGSAEKVTLNSVRWDQTGSAGPGDLDNVMTYVDGVAYPVSVSNDVYTTVFPGGLEIDKGFSKEISVKGDISGGSGRNVAFDIAKRTDVNVVGNLYGYGLTPPQTNSCGGTTGTACFTSSEDPWYDGAVVTVTAGTINVSTSSAVPAQNISVNTLNVAIGAFDVDVRGESISVAKIPFNLQIGNATTEDGDDLTNIVLVDANGSVVAGPVDGTAADSSDTTGSSVGSFVFSDTVTFPVGINTYTIKAKVGTDLDTDDTLLASTTPTDWGTVRGSVTGNTITPSPASALTTNTMTIKAGALTVSVSSIPLAQTVIAGESGFTYANYILDVSSSGEDVRLTTIPLYYDTSGTATDVSNCQLMDGSTSVTSGSNVVNPSAVGSSTSFTFDGTGLLLSKGTSKTLSLVCDLSSGATGIYWWGLDTGQASGFTGATGLTSGQTVTETLNEANGQLMTSATGGTLTPTLDTGSPGYRIVSAGSTGVELSRIKFSALNEDISLQQVALQLTDVASNTPNALVGRKVTLWDTDGNEYGSATFPTGDFATSTLTSTFTVPNGGSKILVVKGDIGAITANGPMTRSGDLLKVDYDGDNEGVNGNYGTGDASGSNITPAGSDTASQGVRIMAAYPTLERVALTSAEKVLETGANTLYKFMVTAVDGDVALYKWSFSVGSSTVYATTTNYELYAYTSNDFSSADTTFSSDGLLNGGSAFNGLGDTTGATTQKSIVEIYPDKTGESSATTTYVVPSGATRYFELRATASNLRTSTGSESISVSLLGDAAYSVNAATWMEVASGLDGDTNDDFLWSPISTTTQNTINDLDFTNGYQVQGLPSSNMTAESIGHTI